jgi:hypothetical protein
MLVGVCKITFLSKVYYWRARLTFSYVVCPRTAYFGQFTTVCEANGIIHILYTESPINLKLLVLHDSARVICCSEMNNFKCKVFFQKIVGVYSVLNLFHIAMKY